MIKNDIELKKLIKILIVLGAIAFFIWLFKNWDTIDYKISLKRAEKAALAQDYEKAYQILAVYNFSYDYDLNQLQTDVKGFKNYLRVMNCFTEAGLDNVNDRRPLDWKAVVLVHDMMDEFPFATRDKCTGHRYHGPMKEEIESFTAYIEEQYWTEVENDTPQKREAAEKAPYPYVGMLVKYANMTKLGAYSSMVGDHLYWESKNIWKDYVFAAIISDGVITYASKSNEEIYWDGDGVLWKGRSEPLYEEHKWEIEKMKNKSTSSSYKMKIDWGSTTKKKSKSYEGYDDPDDYAEDNADEWADYYGSYEDAYDELYEEFEEYADWD